MAALTADDVTVTISQRNIEDRPGFLRHALVDLTFGDGTSTHPSGGIPLPAIGNYGFKRSIVIGLVEPPAAANMLFHWIYDRTNHTLMATGVSLMGSTHVTPPAGASVFYQVPTTWAPPETTVRVLFFGE